MPWCFGSQVFDVAELRLLAAGKAWETGKKMETDTGHRTEAERRSFFLARLLSDKVSLLFHRANGATRVILAGLLRFYRGARLETNAG
jgi:hypothetical protein